MNILNQINENEYLKIKVKDLENDLAKEQNKAQYFKKAQKRIEELETKLTESEEFTQGYRKECAKIQSENVKLKQQLAEKERKLQEAMTNCVNLANTRAISNLNKVQDRIDDMKSKYDLDIEYHLGANNELAHLWEFIDQLIVELKGEK